MYERKSRKLHNLPWDVLAVLATTKKGLTFKELTSLTHKDKSTVADNVAILENAGLVEVTSRQKPRRFRGGKRWVRVVKLAEDLRRTKKFKDFFSTAMSKWLSE